MHYKKIQKLHINEHIKFKEKMKNIKTQDFSCVSDCEESDQWQAIHGSCRGSVEHSLP